MRRALVGVPLAALLVSGCGVVSSATQSYSAQTLGASWGPCGAPRDSVLARDGEPAKRIYGDEEDVTDGTRTYQQEWAWRLPPDSARVVTFRWGDQVRRCEVRERRLRWAAWEREI